MLALLTRLGLQSALSEGFLISLIIPVLASGTEGRNRTRTIGLSGYSAVFRETCGQ